MNKLSTPWPAVISRLLATIVGSGAIGWLLGSITLGMLAGTLCYLAWNLSNQARLERWLREGRKLEPPASRGLWGDIFNGIHRLQKRQRKRRKRLTRILQGVRETINAMPDGAVILRDNGEIQWWNGAARELLGLRWPNDEGQRIANLFRHPEFSVFIREHHTSASSITVPSPVNEALTLEVRVIPYGLNQRLLLARDITRLHRLERMRRDFVANISHELRTPLTVIHGLSETLSDTVLHDVPQAARPLEMIEQQTQRMQRLVEDLLMLSRLEIEQKPIDQTVVDVPRVLQLLVEEAKALSGDKQHRIVGHVEPDLCVYGDESELRSAFSNLVFNAVKYTPAGGRIDVYWGREGGRARFAVSDTGIGIPSHHLPRLTERFYRVDGGRSARTGGTGLGLAIVKHVLSRYGIRLQIRSELGQGSTFSCSFPEDLTVRRPDQGRTVSSASN
ncbi:MAG: phosphate regulon sensor histidine kinase PhoR [Ectothiorhodospiraceae bacterium]|nr:phosphate regulon sensor histidine kinase PhoR [Ectothiorhodospiraceae bacterium]